MTKKVDEAKAAGPVAVAASESNPLGDAPVAAPDSSADEGARGQSMTLDQIRASGLDPAVYGFAPDA